MDTENSWRRVTPLVLLSLAIQGLLGLLAPMGAVFAKYPAAAEQWSAGILPAERLADLSPLYFELNLAIWRLGGSPAQVLPVLQILAVALAVGLLAHRLSHRGLSYGWAVLATIVMSLDSSLLVYARILEPEALLLLSTCAWLAAFEGPLTRWRIGSAGLWAALGISLRPTLLPLHLAVVPLALAFRLGHDDDPAAEPQPGRWLRWSLAVGLYLLPIVLVLGWSSHRLAHALGRNAPSMSPGTVFYEGNHPLSNGTSAVYPPIVRLLLAHSENRNADGSPVPDAGHVLYREVARQELGDPAAPIAAVNRFWAERAVAFLRDYPGQAWILLSTKIRYVFHLHTWHDVPSAAELARRLPLPGFPFSLLAALSLFFLLRRSEAWRQEILDLGLLACQLGVLLVFYVSGRQRLILLPVLVYFAVRAIHGWRAEWRARPKLARWGGVALVALLFLSLSFPDAAQRDDSYSHRLASRAAEARRHIFAALGERFFVEIPDPVIEFVALSPAEYDDLRPTEFPQSLLLRRAADRLTELLPQFSPAERASAELDLAGLELRSDDPAAWARAENRARRLVEEDQHFFRGSLGPSEPSFFLARALARLKRPVEANQVLAAALLARPADPFLLAERYALTQDPADLARIHQHYSVIDADWLVGRAALFHGRHELAYQHLGAAARRFPKARRILLELAAACGNTGRDDEGVAHLTTSLKLAPVPVAEAHHVVPMIQRWASQHPEIPAQLHAISLLQQHGAFAEATPLLAALPPAALEQPFGRRAKALDQRGNQWIADQAQRPPE